MKNNRLTQLLIVVCATSLILVILSGCKVPALMPRAGDQVTTAASETPADQPVDNQTTAGKTEDPDGKNTGFTADPSDEQIIFGGTIISVDDTGRSFLAAVDQADQAMLGDKASVGLYSDAKVVRLDTGAEMDLKDVPAGSTVVVTITGGIRESYPVQVSAILVEVTLID